MQPRLKAELWVKAHVRQCYARDLPAYVVRRGDADRGGVVLKITDADGLCRVYQPTIDFDGARRWRCLTGDAPVPEAEADAAIAGELRIDPDLWVVEVEDRLGHHELDAPLLDG